MKKNGWLMTVCLALLALNAMAVTPLVSNVRAQQEPTYRCVDVWYDLAMPGGNPAYVTMAVSTNDGATYTFLFTSSGVPASGALGSGVLAGQSRWIRWWPEWSGLYNRLIPKVRIRITAADNITDGDYLVIDLSAGPSASSYSVSYLTAVPGGGWTDEYKTTKLVMRRIPAGTFTMGSPPDELGRESDVTQHQVTMPQPFYMGVFEVTQKQWERVMGTWPSYFNNAGYRDARPVEQVSYYQIRENPNNTDDPAVDWPANSNVTADSFMGKLRAKTGLSGFDLPTESQWEYSGRAGTATSLNSGYNLTNTSIDAHLAEVERYWYNGGSSYGQSVDTSGATAKAGCYLPNAWGLYDMHGNVCEWCLD